MGIFRGPNIVRDGLVFSVDAGSIRSYPGSGTVVTDLSQGVVGVKGSGVLFNTVNGVNSFQFTSLNATNLITFDSGTDDYEFETQTVCIWFRTTTVKQNMDFVTGTNSTDMSDRWRHQTSNSQGGMKGLELDWIANQSWSYFSDSIINYDDGEWHYFCSSYNNTDKTTNLWYDGELNIPSNENTTQDWTSGSGINRVNIGGDGAELTSNFIGDISVVKIYNRVLTGDEIKQNYNAQKNRFNL